MLGVELLEHVGLELAIGGNRIDDLLALLVRGRLDEVGDLGGMELREPPEPHLEPGGRDVADERLDARPVEERLHTGAFSHGRRKLPAQVGAEARIDPDHAPPALDPSEHEVVGAHEFGAHDVDHPPLEQVLTEQHLALAALERPRSTFSPTSCTPPGPSAATRSAGTNTSRPPIRALSPVSGG